VSRTPSAPASPSTPGAVLRLLLEAGTPRSGQEMARRLGCSRAAVGKAVASLRAQGFVIEARPRRGYRLVSEPQEVLPARVEARLRPGDLGLPLLHFPRIDSTNLEARRRCEGRGGPPLPHGACLVAEHQSAGRGRLDRRWLAPPRTCLLFSLVLRPPLALERVFALTNLAAVAVCLAVEEAGGLKPAIKWPNDVFLQGRKLAGILTEFASRAERLEYAVVGVGLNVNLTPSQLRRLPAPAISLKAATGRAWDRAVLLARILRHASDLYRKATARGWRELARHYRHRSLIWGRRVVVRDGEQVRQGRVQAVEPDGTLRLRLRSGRVISIRHGDVSLLSVQG